MQNQSQHLIGPAAAILARLKRNLPAQAKRGAPLKILLHGDPGTGKTTLADFIAALLAPQKLDRESINGRNLTIEVVREWQQNQCYGSLFGGWKIKIINEVDLAPQVAQDLMLTLLDELPPRQAVIATSNATRATLTDRFATRFTPIEVAAPPADEIARMIRKRHHLTPATANMIAAAALGNVRDALKQAEGFALVGVASRPAPKPTVAVICASRSDAARRAIETQRANRAARLSA